MKRGRYPTKFKENLVSRFLQSPEYTITGFAVENGVPESSLRAWIRESENGTLGIMKKDKYPRYWDLSKKFEAIQEFDKLSEIDQGKWLRSNGISSERVDRWRNEIKEILSKNSKSKKKSESKDVKDLKKELKIKEKALAEASAILFAKKKLDAFFGDREEEN